MINALEKVSQARQLLESARCPAEWREIARVASAAKAYLRGRDDAHAAWIAAGEIELRAEKRLADYKAALPKARGTRGQFTGSTPREEPVTDAVPLPDLGIPSSGKYAQKLNTLAAIPIDVFESRLAASVAADTMPTVSTVSSVSADPDYDGDSWCTPPEWIARARAAMGGIDLDPATNPGGQSVVRASTAWMLPDDDALDGRPWFGRVWLNPPYSTAAMQRFAQRVLVQDFDQAVILVNNCTDAAWFDSLSRAAQLVAFTRGRIQFLHPKSGQAFATRQGQALFYFGAQSEAFAEAFGDSCAVYTRLP